MRVLTDVLDDAGRSETVPRISPALFAKEFARMGLIQDRLVTLVLYGDSVVETMHLKWRSQVVFLLLPLTSPACLQSYAGPDIHFFPDYCDSSASAASATLMASVRRDMRLATALWRSAGRGELRHRVAVGENQSANIQQLKFTLPQAYPFSRVFNCH